VNDPIRITSSLRIPSSELRFTFSTSSGPGGQHTNKAATRVDLAWNVNESRAIGPRQRDRILAGLGNRIDSRGVLRLSSDRYRSQWRNRAAVVERFRELVAGALKQRKHRKPTTPSVSSRERRLADKRRRSETKRGRAAVRYE
jgi:ribosome-associated protein